MDHFRLGAFAVHLAVASLAGLACVLAWRWVARRSHELGLVVAAGILLRAASGLALFVISYFELPFLRSLQMGHGFWHLAPDAQFYFNAAASSALGAVTAAGSPSPSFIEAFGFWLRATGLIPSSAVLFNLVLYVASCTMIVAASRPARSQPPPRAILISLCALSFSPMLILMSTQALKDTFSAFLIVLAATGAARLLRPEVTLGFNRRVALPVAALAVAILLMAGVRTYYGLFMWGAAAGALGIKALFSPRASIARAAAVAFTSLAVLWLAFMRGAGPYYVVYGNLITQTIGVHLPVISPASDREAIVPDAEPGMGAATASVSALRKGFINTGGATNLVSDSGSGSHSGRAFEAVIDVLAGLAALFVPISLLKLLSIVEFSGGRGFLLVADMDTLFVDVALGAVAWLCLRSGWPARHQWPSIIFSLGLGLVTAVLMAYIVTNYGTLVRLRLLATVPLWLVPLAYGHCAAGSSGLEKAEPSASSKESSRSRTDSTELRGLA